jgi:hypothetical protein
MKSKAVKSLAESITLEPRLNLVSLRKTAAELEWMSKRDSLGPFEWNPGELYLEVNGTVIASGTLSMGKDGAEFIINEIRQEDEK